MISSLLVNNLLGCLRSKESRPKLGKSHSESTVLHFLLSLSLSFLQFVFGVPGGVVSSGMKSAGLCVICGAGVPFPMIQFEPVTT